MVGVCRVVRGHERPEADQAAAGCSGLQGLAGRADVRRGPLGRRGCRFAPPGHRPPMARPRTVQGATVTASGSRHEHAPSAPAPAPRTRKPPQPVTARTRQRRQGTQSHHPRQSHAVAHDFYGRIPETLLLCTLATEEPRRRDIMAMRNLQEGRHALAAKIFHGKKGELYQRYHEGTEDQLGVLGLVLNCVVLWTTVYLDAAVRQLRAQGYPVREEDMARLSPFVSRHPACTAPTGSCCPTLSPARSATCATSTHPMTTRTRPDTSRPLLRHWPFGCCSSPRSGQ